MIANSLYKKTESDDDEDEDSDGDSVFQYNEAIEDRTIRSKITDITIEQDAYEGEIEVERRGASASASASTSASEDMSKILEEIRLIERGMFFDAIDPVAKR